MHIEDNSENRLLVKRILISEGYRVIEANCASSALNLLKTNRPDVILMDINMPDLDGYTLTSQLKSLPQFANTPIIAITANVMKGDREKSLQSGCDDYIEKPIDIDRFIDLIARFIG